ncbi:MAG: electron transport complex subunit RsxC [candidate division WOR-3 bacterium]|nr:electron transport complex subunit RsxC [candidate division WOR-3 bacterium]
MFSFFGGVHPTENKESTHAKRIESAPIPHRVFIPFSQHTGIPSKPIVNVGDLVKVGTKIGEINGRISVPTHATISGKVTEIKDYPHPVLCQRTLTCVIESDGQDIWDENVKRTNSTESEIKTLINIIAEAGIVGLGGAAFPTHIKLSPPKEKPIETLIINGCECEPYLTADHRMMVEHPTEIIEGAKIIAKIINPKRIIIVIEDNKPDAIAKIKETVTDFEIPISVVAVKTKYPQGAEKQLIKAILGAEVPTGGLPMDVKTLVQNVQTCYAIYEAVNFNKPLVEKVITITGQVKEPKNLRVRIGTPIIDLVNLCGGYLEPPQKVILGGPMMGNAQFNDELPIIKGTSGILVLTDGKISEESPCIRCASCVKTCPMNLMPCEINSFIRLKKFDKAKEYNVMDCIECGCCAYVCPANIRLIHSFKFAKNEIWAKEKK